MRLETSLNTGREGLLVHGTALNTVADNLANSNTTGFKDTRVEFGDLISDGGASLYSDNLQSGSGATDETITVQHLSQGTLDRTSRPLDAAINGKGWFILNDGTTQYYTRAGNFTTNEQGELIGQNGAKVMGYTVDNPDTLSSINLTSIVGKPSATSTVNITGNLTIIGENTTPPAAVTFENLYSNAGFRTSSKVIDSLGESHDISLFFFKTANQTWTVQAYADGADTGGTAGTPVLVGSGNLLFGTDGKILTPTAAVLTLNPAWGNGSSASPISLDLSNFTSTASGSNVSGLSTDGLRGGVLKSVSIDTKGQVVALLESGESVVAATLALGDFVSPDGLQRVGQNMFVETNSSGEVRVGKPASKGLGEIQGQTLESSTVDTAEEFTTLIRYQQGYRASSQIIQSISELIKSTIQIA